MFNLKWAVFPAGAAFLLALLSSLIFGQVGFALALLRAFVFGGLFFGIGCGAWVLINTFIPELLFLEGKKEPEDGGVFQTDFPSEASDGASGGAPAGSKIDITLGDGAESVLSAALPGDSYGIDGIGNISELVSKAIDPTEKQGDIDQAPANNYNSELGDLDFANTTDVPEKPAPARVEAADGGGLGDFSSFFDGLTGQGASGGDSDDSLTDLFQTFSGGGAPAGSEESPKVERKARESNPVEMKGDFSPKEIAAGIRTVLAKEKKRG